MDPLAFFEAAHSYDDGSSSLSMGSVGSSHTYVSGSTETVDEFCHQRTRKVKFDSVYVADFPIGIGAGVVPKLGAPISLQYDDFSINEQHDLEEYEYRRDPIRRSGQDLYICPEIRNNMLLQQGYTPNEVNQAMLDTYEIQKEREAAAAKPTGVLGGAMKSTKRALKNMVKSI